MLAGRIKASKGDDDVEEPLSSSEEAAAGEYGSDSERSRSSPASGEEDEEGGASENGREYLSQSPQPATDDALSTISFGALASAQESLGIDRKRRKTTHLQERSSQRLRSTSPFHEASERRAGKEAAHPARASSKHAPAELSSKKAVSRKRTAIAVPKPVARDPRFSALSGQVDLHRVEQNYSFLNEYRQSELATLKSQVREAKDEEGRERLRQRTKAMEDQERARSRAEEMKAVAREHRKKERVAVRDGKKPFFLKSKEVKQLALKRRFEEMGEKRAEKVIARRRKKMAGRERKAMPMARRGAEDGGG